MGLYETRAILGQTNPAATTDTVLYDVSNEFGADDTDAVVGCIVICNQGADGTFRVSIVPDGGAPSAENYLYYDHPLAANESYVIQLGIALNNDGSDDQVRVYASHANMSFTAIGVEIDGTV
jgi:hypothetical protein